MPESYRLVEVRIWLVAQITVGVTTRNSAQGQQMTELPGTPSDNVTAVLQTGNGGIGTLFVSMATRHPGGSDADYLRWHTLDHRPEQHRLAALRASLRLVSTPACRSVRAVSHQRFDPVDHVMTYFFTDPNGLTSFLKLGKALRDAGRIPTLLPPVERGAYEVRSKASAPHVKVGADVLPWWPVQGVFLLVEKGTAPATGLLDVDGVAGVWSASAASVDSKSANEPLGQSITYCFLDDDPVDTAIRLQPLLARRWQDAHLEPLLAAPFYPVVPHEWERHLP
jgi:hypothetical protein